MTPSDLLTAALAPVTFKPVRRAAFRLAHLAREGLGEIVVRHGKRTLERRTFPLEQVPREVKGGPYECPCQDCEQARQVGRRDR